MAKITVQIKNMEEVAAKLEKLGIEARVVLKPAIDAAGKIIEAAADSDAPGPNNVREFVNESASKVEMHVGPDKAHWYYRFIETGTSAHAVVPKKKKVLKLYQLDGRFAPWVGHPGSNASPFLRPAVDEHGGEAQAAAGEVFKKALT